jgi:hypothetical protein
MKKNDTKIRLFEMMERLNPDFRKTLNETIAPQDLNEILKGYIEAALWTEEEQLRNDAESFNDTIQADNDYDEEDTDVDKLVRITNDFQKKTIDSFGREDIDADSLIKAYTDIKEFIRLAGDNAVNEAIDEKGYEQLGHDIWLTRNGHGAGFFDHSYENEQPLMNAAKALKEVDLYVGDDMKLYFSNAN